MKRPTRTLSITLTFVILFSLTLAFAASATPVTTGNNIEVRVQNTAHNLEGQKLSIYKVFDLTIDNNPVSFAYTLAPAFAGLPAYLDAMAATPDSRIGDIITQHLNHLQKAGTYAANIFNLFDDIRIIGEDTVNGDIVMRALADTIYDYVKSAPISATQSHTVDTNLTSYTFSTPELGYYLVTGSAVTSSAGDPTVSLSMLLSNSPIGADGGAIDTVIHLKLDVPTIDKQVRLAGDPGAPYGKYVDANIGDVVQFKITLDFTNYKHALGNIFRVQDTLSPGLTLVRNAAGDAYAYIPGIDYTEYTYDMFVNSSNYDWPMKNFTVHIPPGILHYANNALIDTDFMARITENADGSTSFTLAFNDWVEQYYWLFDFGANRTMVDTIEITYFAKLNENALISDNDVNLGGNPNKARLDYNNDPYSEFMDEPGGKTPDEWATVYTFGLDIFKFTGSPSTVNVSAIMALPGAKFRLYMDDGGGSGGTVGTYNPSHSYQEVMFRYYSSLDAYVVDPSGTDILTSNAMGKIFIRGLKPGNYFLIETQAPDGYNLLQYPVVVSITATYGGTFPDFLTQVKYFTVDEDGAPIQLPTRELGVQNNAGAEFPGTGGIGRRIFIFAGLALMAAALLTVIIRKKVHRAK